MKLKKSFFTVASILFLLTGMYSCRQKKESNNIAEIVEVNSQEDFVRIFDGKTLTNWKGDFNYWRVEGDNLVGEVTPEALLKNNTFIIWQGGRPDDFELKLEFKIATSGNSGINYRSDLIDTIPHALKGYQADIDGKIKYTGQNYEEKKRTTLAYRGEKVLIYGQDTAHKLSSLRANIKKSCWQSRKVIGSLGVSDSLKTKIRSEDWNEIHLVVKGTRLQHYVNSVLMSDVTDNDTINRKLKGYLGMQLHVGPPMKVAYRNIQLKKL